MQLCAKIEVKKAWDEEKIKLEDIGSDFPSMGMACACGTALSRAGERTTPTDGSQSASATVPTDKAPCDA